MVPSTLGNRAVERTGRVTTERKRMMLTLLEQFEERFIPEPNSGCWLWLMKLTSFGYGQIKVRGKPSRAHRISYELYRGPIPDDLGLDHLCRIKSCVNPFHLEPVPQKTNVLRGIGLTSINAKKTHCIHGHAFDEQNTRLKRWRNFTMRVCRECNRLKSRKYRLERRMDTLRRRGFYDAE
jgi:hypothetical protein